MASEKSYILKSLDELNRTTTLGNNDLFYTLQPDTNSGSITYNEENAKSITLNNLSSEIKRIIAQSSTSINYNAGTTAGNILLIPESGKLPATLLPDAQGSTSKGIVKLGDSEQNLRLEDGILTLNDNLQFEPGSINPNAITHEKVIPITLPSQSANIPLNRSENGVSPIYYVNVNNQLSPNVILEIDNIFTGSNAENDGYEFSVILDYRVTTIDDDYEYVNWYKNTAISSNKIGTTQIKSSETVGHFLFFTFKLFKVGNDIQILPINSYIL